TSDTYTLCAKSEYKEGYFCADQDSGGISRTSTAAMFGDWGAGGGSSNEDWLAGYTTRRKITIDQTKVDEDLADFPVLVKLTSANFDFSEANDDGYDIRFTASDGLTLLSYEREQHDSVSEEAEYWVKVPSVSGTVDTEIYIYYTTTVTADGAEPESVWDENYVMVQHMKDNTTSATLDSTGNNNDGTKGSANNPLEADGKIGKGQTYDVNSEKISTGDVLSFEYNEPFSVEAWASNTTDNVYGMLACKDRHYNHYSPYYRGWYLWKWNSAYGHTLVLDLMNDGDQPYLVRVKGSTALNDTTLRHLSSTYSGSGIASGVKLYVNGELETMTTQTDNLGGRTILPVGGSFNIGNRDDASFFGAGWIGIIDEVRISNIVRSAEWLKASYNSGNDTLLTCGDEEILP
ncbi:MAG: DUF2341 domain-containing protein, partial [Candidatus Paceibacterota bacterium]